MSDLTDRLTPDKIRTLARIMWQAQERGRERHERERAERQAEAAPGTAGGNDGAA
jgi:hypothetical protein